MSLRYQPSKSKSYPSSSLADLICPFCLFRLVFLRIICPYRCNSYLLFWQFFFHRSKRHFWLKAQGMRSLLPVLSWVSPLQNATSQKKEAPLEENWIPIQFLLRKMEDSGIFADLCNDPQSNNLLSNDVILSGIVICDILFTSDKLFRVEQLPIG